MNKIVIAALAAAWLGSAPAANAIGAAPSPWLPPAPDLLVPVQSDCRSIGQQIADQNGGTLADAHVENRGGQNVCVGVVVVPARGGERGRRIPFAVPM